MVVAVFALHVLHSTFYCLHAVTNLPASALDRYQSAYAESEATPSCTHNRYSSLPRTYSPPSPCPFMIPSHTQDVGLLGLFAESLYLLLSHHLCVPLSSSLHQSRSSDASVYFVRK
ncbi:hypothetical protein BC629DRAFT_1503640 [Irpex lacteus]|nr:hypothetical protein BC629DRAFT_1503640 [Irpex lacteus]